MTGPRALRVLVVDDNADTARSLAMLLRLHRIEVEIAFDGATACDLAAQWHPDVMILDIALPQLNGYDLAKRLRQTESLAGIELIAYTGYGRESDRQRALEAGFNHHLTKPADPDRLLELLRRISSRVVIQEGS